jgi:glycosyltransferase involved in cell wall biosynthesis
VTRVSVALCTYNGERYIDELLASLAAQELLPDELVVCDDRSSDGTVTKVQAFAEQAPFPVRLEVNERNLGPTKNFELAISRCEGEFIALCDQDDVWYPHKLERSIGALTRNEDVGYVFSDADMMDEQGRPLDRRMWDAVGFFESRRQAALEGRMLELLVVYTFVQGAATTFRSDLRELLLPIPHGWLHDAWIALLSAFVRPYLMIEEPLLRYRIHGEQEIGVPSSVMPDDTGIQKWKVRLQQAPEKVSLKKADLHRQRRRTQSMLYDQAAQRIEERGRSFIEEHGGALQPLATDALRDVHDRARHLRIRGSLPDSRVARIGPIAKELRSRRYGRYSAGVLSALQDLVS